MGLVIVFRSVTYAQKAEYILTKNGITCGIIKVPAQMNRGSCAHGIKLNVQNGSQAIKLIRSFSLPYTTVYKVDGKGKWEVVI